MRPTPIGEFRLAKHRSYCCGFFIGLTSRRETKIPYPGVPDEKTDEMERCVADLMKDKKMKEKYPDSDERKEHAIAICHDSITDKGVDTDMQKKKWSTKYINDLPDSAFAYIEPGGEKDEEGKATPRSLRHLPYKDKEGNIDPAHVRNALARLPQTDVSDKAKAKARKKLVAAAKKVGVDVSEKVENGLNVIKITVDTNKISEFIGRELVDALLVNLNTEGKGVKTEVVKKKKEKLEKKEDEIVEEEVEEDTEVEGDEAEEESVEEESTEKAEDTEEEDETESEDEAEEEDEEPEEEETEEEEESEKAETAEVTLGVEELKSLFKSLSEELGETLGERLDNLEELLKSAPTEGASDEETPEEEEVDEPEEEETKKVKDGASSEGAEKILKNLENLAERVKKLEESPAPSSVVVSKVVGDEDGNETDSDLDKIEKRLDELYKIRKSEPHKFTDELQAEAFKLLDKKTALERQ